VLVTGSGVEAKIAENYRRLNNQEMSLLNEQLRILRREVMSASARAEAMKADDPNMTMMSEGATNSASTNQFKVPPSERAEARKLIDCIEKRTAEYVPNPACAAIASLVMVDVTVVPNASPGEREIRLVTLRGISNPLPFYVGQFPEISKEPMVSARKQILGKEAQALRRRSPGDDEDHIKIPCTVNGQIGSSEVNRYRFQARKGQQLVITTLGRRLVPFIADAVPGWFQPVLALYDAEGHEVAYDDDYRFKPDPTIFYSVPRDGEYSFTIRDSLYRGREDFVYRITIGELPFITSIFPLGGNVANPPKPNTKGWNLKDTELSSIPAGAQPDVYSVVAGRKHLVSNRVPFALDTLPETVEQEPNNTTAGAQKVTLPIILNGRIGKPNDWDVFQFTGKSNQTIVAEVDARRLDSPLDSVIKLTDTGGNLLAFNDDHEDLAAGVNTHLADSYLIAKLPADGAYCLHIGDTARQGGEEYAYRLRISHPRPDFELRVVPSSLGLRSKSGGGLTVYVQRKDGFAGPIKLALKDPPGGFSASPVTVSGKQISARINIRTSLVDTQEPVSLSIFGTAKVGDREIVREAVPAEDQMQAFLWRHLVPAKDLEVLVYNPRYQPPPRRIAPVRPRPPVQTTALASTTALGTTNALAGTNSAAGTNATATVSKPRFTKQQVAWRLRQLKRLYEDGLLTDDFYLEKVAELDAAE